MNVTSRIENDLGDLLRVRQGFELSEVDTGATPGFEGGKAEGKLALLARDKKLAELQELLFANGFADDRRRVLLVLQAMDTAGKGGIVRHVVGSVDPQGVHLATFKAPTDAEKRHDFLWRIRKQVPPPGTIGVFDRSHYEDVLIARVEELVDEQEIERRYQAINDFEKSLVDSGTVVIKCMLNVSAEEQKARLLARLDEPAKQWKFKPDDVDEREHWAEYQTAYEVALERCNTDAAPWYVVPSDHKWYRNWAVAQLLVEAMRGMKLDWPEPDYDVAEQRKRLEEENSEKSEQSSGQP